MNEIPKISFLIPSKNNLRYLKWSIPSIRENAYRNDHDIVVFVDKDDDGTVSWLEDEGAKYDVRYIENTTGELYGIGRAYDTLIYHADTDIVCVFHADMYLCKDADLHAVRHIQEQDSKTPIVVCSTRIEPPLHPAGKEKIVKDFGLWPEPDVADGFKKEELHTFVDAKLKENINDTNGLFAPWYVKRSEIVKIGGHDYQFRSAREDSDLFNRMKLDGWTIVQSWKSYVYHLTCRAGQFQHGILTTDNSQKSAEWQQLMNESTLAFIKKWGTYVHTDEYLHPIVPHRHTKAIILPEALFIDRRTDINLRIDNRNLKEEEKTDTYLNNFYDRIILFNDRNFDFERINPDNYPEDVIVVANYGTTVDKIVEFGVNFADIFSEVDSTGAFTTTVGTVYVKRNEPIEHQYIDMDWTGGLDRREDM